MPASNRFKGHSFHTSRWDYDYTGGDPSGAPMDKLADKRVGIIGTGATSVQCVPYLARACKELYVFQRTPSSVDVRANAPIDPEWFSGIATPGWQQRWLENFTANQAGGNAEEDLVQDGWTDLSRRIRAKIMQLPREQRTVPNMRAAFEDSDFEKMEEIRNRVDAIVGDRETAGKLKAWYGQLCKRPCFHDEYLQAFNTPGHASGRHRRQGGRADHRERASSSRARNTRSTASSTRRALRSAPNTSAGPASTCRAGTASSCRSIGPQGMRTKHGIHVHGFPNAFFVQPTQGANLISNVPHNLTEAAKTIAMMVKHAQDNGFKEIEVTKEAEDKWIELLLTGVGRMIGGPDCTPGYYNNEGHEPGPAAQAECRPSRRRDGLLQVYRRVAQHRRVRRAAVSLKPVRPVSMFR